MLQRPASSPPIQNLNIVEKKDLQRLKGLKVDDAIIDLILEQASRLVKQMNEATANSQMHREEESNLMKEQQITYEAKLAEMTKRYEKQTEELKKVQTQLSTTVQKSGKPLQAKEQTILDLKDELERMDRRLEEAK